MALAAALLAVAFAAGPVEARKKIRDATNPSTLIATEIAFNRMAQERGQWTAFRKFAAEDAVMFVPEAVNAPDWLKGRADPPSSVVWQPHEVWMSCDGTLGATRGAWQRPDGSTGYFTTIWQRQKNESYKWVMDQGDGLATPLAAPELIAGRIADCRRKPGAPPAQQSIDGQVSTGMSIDGTLSWQVAVKPDSGRHVVVSYWDGSQWQSVIDASVKP